MIQRYIGKTRFYEKKGSDGAMICVHKHTASRVVWGHAPQETLYFRLSRSQIASGAFLGT